MAPKINSRAKGGRFERRILKDLEELTGIKGRRTSDGYNQSARGDIQHEFLEEYSVEAKHREQVALPKWIEQAESDAAEGKEPIVVWRTNKIGPYVNMRWEHFLDLVERAAGMQFLEEVR